MTSSEKVFIKNTLVEQIAWKIYFRFSLHNNAPKLNIQNRLEQIRLCRFPFQTSCHLFATLSLFRDSERIQNDVKTAE